MSSLERIIKMSFCVAKYSTEIKPDIGKLQTSNLPGVLGLDK
jgi:hypothetical protein